MNSSAVNVDVRTTWLSEDIRQLFGVVTDKKKLTNEIFSALQQHNLGGVVQKPGGNNRSFSLICRSLSPHGDKAKTKEGASTMMSDITNFERSTANQQTEETSYLVPQRDESGA